MHKHSTTAPQPEKRPLSLKKHEDVRLDQYHWLRERENPVVLEYLKKENQHTAEAMQSVKSLEKNLFTELKSRIKEDESSVPAKDGPYFYSVRYEVGQQYPIYIRQKENVQATAEVLMNVPEMAQGKSFFQTTGPQVSPNHEMLAYGVDTIGRRFYTLFFKDLKNENTLDSRIENVSGNFVWANDNTTLFYVEQNKETLRAEKIYSYNIKTNKKKLVYFEKDETFSVFVYRSMSDRFIYILSNSTLTTEVQYVDANKPEQSFKIFSARERGHEYSVTDGEDQFYILTNKNAKNFKIATAELQTTEQKYWKDLIPHRADTLIQDISVFKKHLVLDERKNGLTQLQVTDRNGRNSYYIPFADESYLASIGDNREYETEWLRFDYESMRLPNSVYDINLNTHEQTLKKTREVPNFNPAHYKTERIFIQARDGAQVPVSLLMKRGQKQDASAPVLIYGYGSYGANMDPWFDSDIFSLIDRGFIFAKAHIRGGSEMGRDWYDQGRTFHKKNTFYDFIDCTEALIQKKYVDPKKVYAMGGSAGGLLMGAIMNMRPELYRGIVAQVPFVDVITTMLDETIPLTTGEYDEWGNPHDKKAYEYIKSYSPYDNVRDRPYPNTLVMTGLHDSQVQYWEPAKWVAKLRDHNKGNSVILLKTDMEAGHGGASGRFDQLKDTATEYAFILMLNEK